MFSKLKKIFQPNSPFYSLMLGLMSFFAVVISLMTLKEMQNQRELALTPIIYSQNFEDTMVFVDTLCDDIYSTNIFVKKNGEVMDKAEEWLTLGLINVGQGSAVDVEVEWDIDYDWFLQYLDTLDIADRLFNIEVFEKEKKIHFFQQECGLGSITALDRNVMQSFSHLLSATQNTEGLKIPIPDRLIKFPISSIRAGWYKNGQNIINSESLSFEHQLKISYNGVNGKKYSSSYKVIIKIFIPGYTVGTDNFRVKAPKDKFGLTIDVEKNKEHDDF